MSFQEYLTSNEEIAFPFHTDAPGLDETGSHGAAATLPLDVFLDALVVMDQERGGTVYLNKIEFDGVDYKFHLRDDDNATVIVDTVALVDLPAVRGLMRLSYLDRSAVFVAGEGFADYMSNVVNGVPDEFGFTLPLEVAAVEMRPTSVTAIRVDDGMTIEDLIGDVSLQEGFNISLDLDEDADQVSIGAIPGDGVGKYDLCDDPEPIDFLGRINSEGAIDENGGFVLAPGTCYRAVPDASNNRILIYNDCTPCCECNDYSAMFQRVRNVFDKADALRITQDDFAAIFNSDVTDFNNLIESKRTLFVTVSAIPNDFVNNKFVTVTVSLMNRGPDLTGVKTLFALPGGFVPYSAIVSYQDVVTQLPAALLLEMPGVLEFNTTAKLVLTIRRVAGVLVAGTVTTTTTWTAGPGAQPLIKLGTF
jgi:hypothetical protein